MQRGGGEIYGSTQHTIPVEEEWRTWTCTQLRCGAFERRICVDSRQRLRVARGLSFCHREGTDRAPMRCVWWTRHCSRVFHQCAESHLLQHDLILHHGRHQRRQEERCDGQILSTFLQYGHAPRGLSQTKGIQQDAIW